jgi:hypothetical protein
MITIFSALVSLLSFRVRSRASLELELVALRHQVAVLRQQRHLVLASGFINRAEPTSKIFSLLVIRRNIHIAQQGRPHD